jgi:hypothetical protein
VKIAPDMCGRSDQKAANPRTRYAQTTASDAATRLRLSDTPGVSSTADALTVSTPQPPNSWSATTRRAQVVPGWDCRSDRERIDLTIAEELNTVAGIARPQRRRRRRPGLAARRRCGWARRPVPPAPPRKAAPRRSRASCRPTAACRPHRIASPGQHHVLRPPPDRRDPGFRRERVAAAGRMAPPPRPKPPDRGDPNAAR